LPFDTCAFHFSTRDGFTEADQRDAFAELNAIVLDTEPFLPPQQGGGQQAPFPGTNTELLYGLYGVDHNVVTPGTNPLDLLVGTAPRQDQLFVPPAWTAQPDFYLEVLKPYCRTCHVAQSIRPLPNTIFTTAAALDVCDDSPLHRMPHASTTMDLFWKGSGRAAFLRAYDTGVFTNGTPPSAGRTCP